MSRYLVVDEDDEDVELEDKGLHQSGAAITEVVDEDGVVRASFDHEHDSVVRVKEQGVNKMPLSFWQLLCLASFWYGYMVYWFELMIVTVPSEVRAIVGDENKGFGLFVLFIVGGVINAVSSIILGYFVDRVYSPFGRRYSWIIAGTILLVPFTMLLPLSQDIGSYTLLFSLLTVVSVIVSVPYNGLFADVVSSSQRGAASAVLGAVGSIGNLSGAILGVFYTTLGGFGMYGIVVMFWIAFLVITYAVIREPAFKREDLRRIKDADQVQRIKILAHSGGKMTTFRWIYATLWYPLFEPMIENVDFRWVFATRFLFQLGAMTVQEFLQYWLHDCVSLPVYDGEPLSAETAVSVVFLPLLISATISALVGGVISDRMGNKRKILIYISGATLVFTNIAFIFVRDFYAAAVLSAVFGAGYGAFLAVDFAIVMDVLPSQDDVARDIALWHLALVFPQIFATPIAGLFLDLFQNIGNQQGIDCLGYTVIWIIAATYIALGTVFINKIKKIK